MAFVPSKHSESICALARNSPHLTLTEMRDMLRVDFPSITREAIRSVVTRNGLMYRKVTTNGGRPKGLTTKADTRRKRQKLLIWNETLEAEEKSWRETQQPRLTHVPGAHGYAGRSRLLSGYTEVI